MARSFRLRRNCFFLTWNKTWVENLSLKTRRRVFLDPDGGWKYLFSSSTTRILRLRASPPGWTLAQYSRSLLAMISKRSLLSGSSCSLERMISITSYQSVSYSSSLLDTPHWRPVMNFRKKFSDCIRNPGTVSALSMSPIVSISISQLEIILSSVSRPSQTCSNA